MNKEEIIQHIAEVFEIPPPAISGKIKTRRVMWARWMAVKALYYYFDWWPLVDLARAVGKKDHSQALHSMRRFDEFYANDAGFKKLADQIFGDLFQTAPTPFEPRA